METRQVIKNRIMAARRAVRFWGSLRWVSACLTLAHARCYVGFCSWYSFTGNDADSLLIVIIEKNQKKSLNRNLLLD
jgi:hypothetical protein